MESQSTLEHLIDVSDGAYQVARREIYDVLPPGAHADSASLTDRQRQLLIDVTDAEMELARYRRAQYGDA